MPQFVRNPKTGEMGYWDGTKIMPLSPVGQNEVVRGVQNAPAVNVQIDPSQPGAAQDAERIRQILDQANPASRAAELTSGREAAVAAAQDPQYLAEKQQEGRESLPGLLKFGASMALPAAISGGASIGTNALVRGAGMIPRLLRMASGAAAGYTGEKANQAVGLSEGGEGSALLGAGLGALPGIFRSKVTQATGDERRLARLAAGQTVAEEAKTARGVADQLYKVARAGADVDTDKLLKPLDDVIMREMNTPNFDEKLVERMMGLRDSLVKTILTIQRGRTQAGVAGAAVGGAAAQPSASTAVTAAAERTGGSAGVTAAGVPAEDSKFWNIFNTVMQGVRGGGSSAAGQTAGRAARQPITGISLTQTGKPVSAENLVDDLKQLQVMAKDAAKTGRTDLATNVRQAYKQMAGEVPGMSAADELYAQGKGLQRGAKAVRSSGAVGVANLLDDPKLSGGLTASQKAFLRKQAAESDRIGMVMQAMLGNPLGRALLKRGITPTGTVVPAAWSAAMQIGARMAGLGGGDGESPPNY